MEEKTKNMWINVGLMLFILVFFVFVIEIVFLVFPDTIPHSIDYLARGRAHYYDPEMFAVLKPGLDMDFYFKELNKTINVKTVSHGLEGIGFRDNKNKLEARKRILVLGDSFAFGTGVNSEDTFVANLDKRIKKGGFDVDVINAGVVGYSSKLELLHYKRFSKNLNPDIVIVALWENDFNDNYIYECAPFIKLRAWLGRNSMMYNLISTVNQLREKEDDVSLKKYDFIPFEEESDIIKKGYALEREDIVRLKDMVRKDGGIFVLLILPGTQNIHIDELYKKGDEFILMDLSSETFKIRGLLHPIHGHYTEESAKEVAEIIYEKMLENSEIKEVLKNV